MSSAFKPALHFVGFRGYEYVSAVRVWGKPDFVHIGNDRRMRGEIFEGDIVVFANHSEAKGYDQSFSDTLECSQLEKLSEEAGVKINRRFGE